MDVRRHYLDRSIDHPVFHPLLGLRRLDSEAEAEADGGSTPDATPAKAAAWACDTPAPAIDLCSALPTGNIVACSRDGNGTPSPTGYLDATLPDGSHVYSCATVWTDNTQGGGYWFDSPDAFMSDPQSCCGGAPTPVANPPQAAMAIGKMIALHGPQEVKPQESAEPGAGPLRHNPFAVVVRDREGAAAYMAALANWETWWMDGNPHPGDSGTGQYYFVGLGVNFVLVETPDGHPTVIIGPEVSTTPDGKSPLGHPTLGACATGGGAPSALMGGDRGNHTRQSLRAIQPRPHVHAGHAGGSGEALQLLRNHHYRHEVFCAEAVTPRSVGSREGGDLSQAQLAIVNAEIVHQAVEHRVGKG